MDKKALSEVAQKLVANNKGLLAADESAGTIKKRFDTIGVESTEENHRRYRQLLFTTEGLEKYISGVIMFDETIRQKTDDGTPFPEVLKNKGIIPGIKVDKGKLEMPGFPGEMVTEGIDGLAKRLEEYKSLGAGFAKWRCVFSISDKTPGAIPIRVNTELLARYAAICQSVGIVPIIEPEVLMDGNHTFVQSAEANTKVLKQLYAMLFDHKVAVEGTLLKASFVHPGKESPEKPDSKVVAEETLKVLKDAVSVAIPGIVFLSGGDSPEEATEHLDALNELVKGKDVPWELSFSYGRALQRPVLQAWQGKDENIQAAQKELLERAKLNSLADKGEYDKSME